MANWTKVFISEAGKYGETSVPLPDGWKLDTANITGIMIKYGSPEYDTIQQLAPNLWIAFWKDEKGEPVPEGWVNHCFIIYAREFPA
jgi:hypothetical protein